MPAGERAGERSAIDQARGGDRVAVGQQHVACRIQDLRAGSAVARPGQDGGRDVTQLPLALALVADRDLVRSRPQRAVDLGGEIRSQASHHERSQRGDHDREHGDVPRGQPDADRRVHV